MTPREISPQSCVLCGADTGTKIVCDACFPTITKAQRQRLDGIFQRTIIELFGNQCVDCPKSAETESGELCADHLAQKNTDPLARYDLANAVCRCFNCHENRHRGKVARVPNKKLISKATQEKAKKFTKTTCKIPRCMMFPARNGLCVLHMKK